MAFESFLTQDKAKPKKWRRVTYTLSLALHGALLLAGTIWSFWHVEEISPPSVTVTFLAAAPPPPPPPPPPKKKKTEVKPKVPTEIVQPKPNQIYQPKEKPPEPEEEDDGVEGGVEGGVVGGVVGGTVGADLGNTGPVMVAPNVGTGQRISDINDPQFKPSLPPALNRAGMVVWGLFKICVTAAGQRRQSDHDQARRSTGERHVDGEDQAVEVQALLGQWPGGAVLPSGAHRSAVTAIARSRQYGLRFRFSTERVRQKGDKEPWIFRW